MHVVDQRMIEDKKKHGNKYTIKLGSKSNGGAENRTPCLSHAKRALYHMSYTPNLLITMSDIYLINKDIENIRR